MSRTNHGTFPGGFFGTHSESGSGVLIDDAVHLADALRGLTEYEYRTFRAEAGSHSRVGDVEDAEQVVVTTTGGAWASIDPSWSHPVSMSGANDLVIALGFENDRFSIDAFAGHGSLVDEDGAVTHLPYGQSTDAEPLDDWLAIRLGSAPPVQWTTAARPPRPLAALATLTSAQYGTVVDNTEQENGSA
ncbi:hypothetical protein F7R91_25225 [Streptomyces luteolifulvus]|uniref:GFO/IDH/MocA-like oxidoreductase domain-containing protein n=1 Tax=Streptomyces luteolifulvus TaxID=2615112 RepID=A0A6H9UW06_9ACTN|nr:hypothetical protein [Streptomyces luteolifulvus]KAB1143472.1 hypothetical protein F7R91_25225 [Streptomyces luteolifulvus]